MFTPFSGEYVHFYPLKKVSIWKRSALVESAPHTKAWGVCMESATSGCAASVFSTWSKNKMFTSPFFRVNIRKPESPACPYVCSRPREACVTQTLCWALLPEEHDDTFHNKTLCLLVLPPSPLRFLLEGFRFPSRSPKPSCEHTRKGVAWILQLYKMPGPLLVLNVCTKLTFF